MVSVMSASCYITPASRYHPRYQSRSSMYIRSLIPRNFTELAEAVPIDISAHVLLNLLNELRKRDRMHGLPKILSLFCTSLINSILQGQEC